MKMIINLKRYDTEKAEIVAEWDNGCGSTDFHHCFEDLYLTKNGNWFFHGRGGPLSKYARSAGPNTYGGSATIIPLSENEAAAWLAEKCRGLFDDHFSHLAKDA